jgi:hypothetical protein
MLNWNSYFKLISRFPFVVVFVFLWTWIQLMKTLMQPELNITYLLDLSLLPYLDLFSRTFSLAIILFLVLTIIYETYFSYMSKIWIDFLGGVLIFIYLISNYTLKSFVSSELLVHQDYIFLMICLIVCFCVVPFFKLSMRSFWKFNNIMFIKLLKVFVYMSFLSLFVVGGLFLFDYLLNVFISLWVYKVVFLICYGCVGSLYFLSQIPDNLVQFEQDTPLPKFYYLISRFYLVPLIYIGGILFYIYIILELFYEYRYQDYMVPFFVVYLIINLFLMLQLGLFKDKMRFGVSTRFYLKYSYYFVFPVVIYFFYWVTLFWIHYGITEFWYLIWFFIFVYILMSIYFIFSSQKDIRVIPFSLLIGCLILSFSPVKPFYVAVNSQYNQLIVFLKDKDMFYKDLKFNFDDSMTLSLADKTKLKDYFYFLDTHTSLHLLQKHYLYPISVDSITISRVFFDFGLLED